MSFKYYEKAARAFGPALREGVTFTKAWFLAQEGITRSYWRYAHVQGLRQVDGYVAISADIPGKDRGKLLTVTQTGGPGIVHLSKDENDQGQAYQMTPYGRFTYGVGFRSYRKRQVQQIA